MRKFLLLAVICYGSTSFSLYSQSSLQPLFSFEDVSFEKLPLLDLTTNSMDIEFTDLDQDGDFDVIVASEFAQNHILLNDGNGKLSKTNLLPKKKHDSEDIVVADFDNNGLLDILFVSEDDKINELYLQVASLTFEDASDRIPVQGISNAVAGADVDQDGDIDLVIGNSGQNALLLNDGKGFFEVATNQLPSIEDPTQDVDFGDTNGDGHPDILVGNESTNYLHLNDGKGFFTKHPLPHNEGEIEETREADFVDIDSDGDLDIFFSNVVFSNPSGKNPNNRILINDGKGSYEDQTAARYKGVNTMQSVDTDFYDLDQDGDFDAIISNAFGTNHQIMINEDGNLIDRTSSYLSKPISMGVDVEIGDLNADGLPDLYFGTFQGADYLLFGVSKD